MHHTKTGSDDVEAQASVAAGSSLSASSSRSDPAAPTASHDDQDDDRQALSPPRPHSRASSASTVIRMGDRLMHVTWAWYLMTMSTGGISVLLGHQLHRFHGLLTIGKIIFMLDLVLFVAISVMLASRFIRQPDLFARSLRNPGECLFTPTLLLSLVNILNCIHTYGGPATGEWLNQTVRVLFWIYVAVSFILAIGVYVDLFTARRMTDKDIVPAWILPILPIMLVGTIGATIAETSPVDQRWNIVIAGITCQGLGFWVAISLYGPLMSRLMRIGLPSPSMRPGMFVAVAPPAYTAHALIKLSRMIPDSGLLFVEIHPSAPEVFQLVGLACGLFVWLLAAYWFCISLVSMLLQPHKMHFTLMWYSMIFPNVGFTLATRMIAQALESEVISWIDSAMSIVLVAAYLVILSFHIHALWTGGILWPGRDEDKET